MYFAPAISGHSFVIIFFILIFQTSIKWASELILLIAFLISVALPIFESALKFTFDEIIATENYPLLTTIFIAELKSVFVSHLAKHA